MNGNSGQGSLRESYSEFELLDILEGATLLSGAFRPLLKSCRVSHRVIESEAHLPLPSMYVSISQLVANNEELTPSIFSCVWTLILPWLTCHCLQKKDKPG